MTAIGQNWLLVVAAVAALVIFSGRAAAVAGWVRAWVAAGDAEAVASELSMITTLVKAAKMIQDAEQRTKVRDACMACFTGWLDNQLPKGP